MSDAATDEAKVGARKWASKRAQKAAPATSRAAQGQLNQRHATVVRMKIQAIALVTRLQRFALADVSKPQAFARVAMTDGQIRAATALLNKIVPDLQRTELTGADGDPIELSRAKARGVADAATASDASGDYYDLMSAAAAASTRH